MKKASWYRITARHDGDDRAEILIYDEIGRDIWGEGIAAEDLVGELSALDVEEIDVRINSMGGQVFEGLAIFNALDRHPATVTTHIDGMAASIASIIALAGDTVNIADNAFMMIHNPHGFSMGDANEMRRMADVLDTLAGSLAETYVAKMGASSKVVREMMNVETWFNAAEALEAGLVDQVTAGMEVAARFDISKFTNVRPDVLDRMMVPVATLAVDGGPAMTVKDADGNVILELAPGAKLEVAADDSDRNVDELVQLAAETEELLARTLL